ADRLTDGTPDDVRFGEGGVVTARLPELALQPDGDAEHSALAGHLVERGRIRVGDVFAEDADALVSRHLLAEGPVDRLPECHEVAAVVGAAGWIRRELGDRWWPQHLLDHARRIRPGSSERLRGRLPHKLSRFVVDRRSLVVADRAAVYERAFEQPDRIVLLLVEQLVRGPVLPLIVRKRMRIRAGDGCVDQPGPLSGPDPMDGLGALAPDLEVVTTIDLRHVKASET